MGHRLLTKFIGICIGYHYYSEVRNLTMGYYLSPTDFVVVGMDARRNTPPDFVKSYLSHITKKAVLCLQVLGGRMLHTPCLPRLQVIVIATSDWRLIGICLAPLFMVKFLHFCTDVGLVENVGQYLVCHAVL